MTVTAEVDMYRRTGDWRLVAPWWRWDAQGGSPRSTRPAFQKYDSSDFVNEFLAKPVSVKAIMSRLVSVIENPRPYVRTKSDFGPCRRRRNLPEYDGPERRADRPALAAE